jgi:hypothetical protein
LRPKENGAGNGVVGGFEMAASIVNADRGNLCHRVFINISTKITQVWHRHRLDQIFICSLSAGMYMVCG